MELIRTRTYPGLIHSRLYPILTIPSFNKVNTTDSILDLNISGYVCSCNSSVNDFSVYNLKHFPGCVLPALPSFLRGREYGVVERLGGKGIERKGGLKKKVQFPFKRVKLKVTELQSENN
jgi:hypothetical protein